MRVLRRRFGPQFTAGTQKTKQRASKCEPPVAPIDGKASMRSAAAQCAAPEWVYSGHCDGVTVGTATV